MEAFASSLSPLVKEQRKRPPLSRSRGSCTYRSSVLALVESGGQGGTGDVASSLNKMNALVRQKKPFPSLVREYFALWKARDFEGSLQVNRPRE